MAYNNTNPNTNSSNSNSNSNSGNSGTNGNGNGNGNISRRNRNTNTNRNKFTGLNKEGMEGIVITDTGSISQQFDTFYNALKVYAGAKDHATGTAIENLEDVQREEVEKPEKSEWMNKDGTEDTEIKDAIFDVYKAELKSARKQHTQSCNELKKTFPVIIGQLDRGITDSLKSEKEYNNILKEKDTIKLIKLLRNLCYRENNAKVALTDDYYTKLVKLLTMKQDNQDDTATFVDKVKMRFDVFKSAGGSFISPNLIEYVLSKNSDLGVMTLEEFNTLKVATDKATIDKVHRACEEAMLATIMVKNCNQKLHNNIDENLRMDFAKGMDNKPMTVTDAQETLNQFRVKNNRNNNNNNNNNGNNSRQNNNTTQNKKPETKSSVESTESKPGGPPKRSAAHQLLLKGGDDIYSGSGFIFAQVAHRNPDDTLKSTYAGDTRSMDVTDAFALAESDSQIDPLWILLDSQATCNLICNPNLVKDIMKEPNGESITLHCNAGTVVIDTIATLPGFGIVWFYAGGIANILSLGLVSDRYRVTLDTHNEQAFLVHKPDGSTRKFKRMTCNLYACNINTPENQGVVLTITAEGKKAEYSNKDVKRADAARQLQEILGYPSLKAYLKMIDNNLIKNCTVTRRDVMMAEDIYGVHPNIVKGKSVRRQPGQVREEILSVPPSILKNYSNVTICIDVYHINGIKFFRSVSLHLMFRMTRAIKDATAKTLFECVAQIHALYITRGFIVVQAFGDNEFNCIKDRMMNELQVTYHPVAKGAHQPHIERDNRVSKERVRCILSSLPFDYLPPRMVIELQLSVDFFLNYWCSSGGVSDTIPPREILTGTKLDVKLHCKHKFGDYVLAHNNDTNNDVGQERAIDAIYLRPTGSNNGGFYVFDLATARCVHRNVATPARMTQVIIDRVHAIAKQQNAPIGITFGDFHNTSTILDIDDAAYDDDNASDADYKDDDTVATEDLTDVEPITEINNYTNNIDDVNVPPVEDSFDDEESVEIVSMSSECDEYDVEVDGNDEEEIVFDDHEPIDIQHPEIDPHDNANDSVEQDGIEDDNIDDHSYHSAPEGPTRESLRIKGVAPTPLENDNIPKKLRSHNHPPPPTDHVVLFTAGFSEAVAKLEREHHEVVMVSAVVDYYNTLEASQNTPQYGVKKGIEIFGEDGVDAVLKELHQLHDLNVVSAVHPNKMTREEVKRALPYLMFLKRKRSGLIKGRGCADGRIQREFISKEEASSPTVSLYALILTCLMAAGEGRCVATIDIAGAFLQTDMPENEEPVHVKLFGPMAELMVEEYPELAEFAITTRKGAKIIYAKANKAIYGTLKAALLFWQKLSGVLTDLGFEANDYDSCTMNKVINGKQATIVWHVDDLMITHEEQGVIDDVIADLEEEFGKIKPLSIHTGQVHEYLGMTIDFSVPEKVKFTMMDYLEDIIATLPENLRTNKNTTSPATDNLFTINPDCDKLKTRQAEIFHSYVAKLLFAAKRARPDLQTAIAFLCTRVKSPDEDDWKKLVRVLGYLKDTLFLPLVLGSDGTGNMYWYVDASFAVHHNMRSHTGGMLTLGDGAAISVSTKQKINTKSSTEAELVAVDDTLPFNIWCYYFLREQGYHANQCEPTKSNATKLKFMGHTNVLYQDNTSSIKLEENGKRSSTKRTRHINIRYFLITDKIKKGEITVDYCPTEEMLADYFTKPLQGAQFRKLRNAIMGISDSDYIQLKTEYEAKKLSRVDVEVAAEQFPIAAAVA